MKCRCTTDYVCIPPNAEHRNDCPVLREADRLKRHMPRQHGHVEWATVPELLPGIAVLGRVLREDGVVVRLRRNSPREAM